MAGEFGATYAIPVIYVPLLMITHITAFYFAAASASQPPTEPRERPQLRDAFSSA